MYIECLKNMETSIKMKIFEILISRLINVFLLYNSLTNESF